MFYSKLLFRGFCDERKFASFSPEFLVLTMSLALRTHSSVTTTCHRLRRGFLKKEAFAGANSAGIRDEHSGRIAKLMARARRRMARGSACVGP
jgi:hypothetical protein